VPCKTRSGEKLKQANDEMILEEIVRDKSNIIQHKTETLESAIMEEICHNEEVRNTTKHYLLLMMKNVVLHLLEQ